MIGEIRDLETAEIAVQASFDPGHLVMSTLHANTAVGSENLRLRASARHGHRTIPYLFFTAGCLAQRLVRTLCNDCKEPYEADKEQKKLFWLEEERQPDPLPCQSYEHCSHKGYRGRTGIHELLMVDESVQELIHGKPGGKRSRSSSCSFFSIPGWLEQSSERGNVPKKK
ncbi:ATPase, T2SS/T4P/T4SS family [Vibrio chagasii]|nr:ATPase, T2SS/T4P/T4SS family [Vibrio chagasii]